MQFLLQAGWNMMPLSRKVLAFLHDYQRTGIVLSARALADPAEAQQCARYIKGCNLLFDTCFYEPNSALSKLYKYPYWDGFAFNTIDFTGEQGKRFCKAVIDYQVKVLKTTAVLLPGRFIDLQDKRWLDMHSGFAAQAASMQLDRPVYATIALGADAIINQAALNEILNNIIQFPVDGIYFVYQPPNDEFLPTDIRFYRQLLTAFLSLTLAQKDIILAYANQSSLVFAAAGVETITSGNWRNTRTFDIQNFQKKDGPPVPPKNWYYDGNSLCEFLPEIIEYGYTQCNLRGGFGPETKYVANLLQADHPSEYPLSQEDAFSHYLTVLQKQWMQFDAHDPNYRIVAVCDFLNAKLRCVEMYRKQGFPLGRNSSGRYSSLASLQAMSDALESFLQQERRLDWLEARSPLLRPKALAFGA